MTEENNFQETVEELHGNIEQASLKIFNSLKLKIPAENQAFRDLVQKFRASKSAESIEVDEFYEVVGNDVNLAAAREAGLQRIPVIKKKRAKNHSKIFPNRILVELSNKCNFSCIMCPAHGPTKDMKRKKENMSFKLFKKVIDEIGQYEGVDVLFHFYGEPLMNPEFPKLMDYFRTQKNIGHSLMSTNGSMLSKRYRDVILDSPLHILQVSINALYSETYKHVTGGHDQARLIENVENFIKEREEKDRKTPYLRVQMVEMDYNENEINGFFERWQGIADLMHANSFEKQGGRAIDQRQNKSDTIKERFFCDRLRRQDFVIYSNGELTVCVYDYDGLLSLGNLHDHTIAELINAEKYKRLFQAHKEGNLELFPICATCTDWMF